MSENEAKSPLGKKIQNITSITLIAFSVTIAASAVVISLGDAKPNASASASPKKSVETGALAMLHNAINNSIAKLGSTGYVQVTQKTGKRVFFDPSYKGEYQVAAKDGVGGTPYVEGSMFEVIPVTLLEDLFSRENDFKVTQKGDIFTVAHTDTAANGTAIVEYRVTDGLIVSATVRDHIGKKNELKVLTICHYGLDREAKTDLVYANKHQTFGHD